MAKVWYAIPSQALEQGCQGGRAVLSTKKIAYLTPPSGRLVLMAHDSERVCQNNGPFELEQELKVKISVIKLIPIIRVTASHFV